MWDTLRCFRILFGIRISMNLSFEMGITPFWWSKLDWRKSPIHVSVGPIYIVSHRR